MNPLHAPSTLIGMLNHSTLVWRYGRNFTRTLHQSLDKKAAVEPAEVASLRSQGILLCSAEEVLDEDGPAQLEHSSQLIQERLQDDDVRAFLSTQNSGSAHKEFMYQLLPPQLEVSSPFIRLALNPRLLSIVNGYLGTKTCLRALNAWLNVPTPASAKETQLWHRDSDDHMNIKVFLYLNDVALDAGPFCFIPRTHQSGSLKIAPRIDKSGRVTDETMTQLVPEREWRICTGPPGTAVLADTTGFHKGLKPERRERLILMFQYTSGRPRYRRAVSITGSPDWQLTQDQRFALFP